jgi:hypothetical protein
MYKKVNISRKEEKMEKSKEPVATKTLLKGNQVLNRTFSAVIQKRTGNLCSIQERVLMEILQESKNTTIGREYNFETIDSIIKYQERIPIHHSDDQKKYWQPEIDGAIGVSLKHRVPFFALTTGTTGEKKLVPVPKRVLANNRNGEMYLLAMYVKQHPESSILRKKILAVSGSGSMGVTPSGIPFGMISGIMAITAPAILKPNLLPKRGTVNTNNWDEKLNLIARDCQGKKIGSIFGIAPSVVDVLKKLKEVYPSRDFQEFVKHLEVLFLSGVNYRQYKQTIISILEKDINFIEYYAASEGVIGHQSSINSNTIELFYDRIFCEFIPFEEYRCGQYHNRKLLNKLKTGEEYVPLITTGNGAFSYVIGDVLRCADSNLPGFTIEGRTKLTMNLAAEKTSITSVENAFTSLAREIGSYPGEFFITTGLREQKTHYLWVIQENDTWQRQEISWLGNRLDQYLVEYNQYYGHFVNKILGPSQVLFVNKEKFETWLEKKGADMGHRKIPRIIVDPNLVQEIIRSDKSR